MGPAAIPDLLDAAAGNNLAFAVPARELLPRFGPEAIEPLIEAARIDAGRRDASWEEAANAVGRMGREALPQVLSQFTTVYPYEPRWYFSVGVLARMDGLTVEPLTPLLKHPTKEVRQEAATLLANVGDPRALDALVEGLHSNDAGVRMECARGLGKIGDHRAGDPLLSALGDPEWGTRAAASAALGRIYEPRFLRPIAGVARGDSEIMTRDTAATVLIHEIHDPVGMRLGRRYKPIALSPARRGAIVMRSLVSLAVTGLLLLGVGALGTYLAGRAGGWRCWLAAGAAASAASVLGFVWGFVIENTSGSVENALLFGLVPAVGLFGFGVVVLESRQSLVRVVRRMAWLATIAAFYLGYGLGWAALWGYFSG